MSVGRRGFTLIELLLVVFILAMLAASTSTLVDGAHDQARYDDTRNRLDLIRRAIVGPDDLTAPVAGYVADVGALPGSVRDLLERPASVNAFAMDSGWHIGSGWRGPYLRAVPRRTNGVLEFPDGWGTSDDPLIPVPPGDPNFGWDWREDITDPAMPSVTIRSAGLNADFETSTPTDDQFDTVIHDDHHVDLVGWRVTVVVNVPSTTARSFALRVVIPDGVGGFDSSDPNLVSQVTTPQPLVVGDNDVTFDFVTSRRIPHGIRAVALLAGTSPNPPTLVPGEALPFEVRARSSLPLRLSGRFEVP